MKKGNIKKIKFTITMLIVIAVGAICTYFINPLINEINFGLDLQGGF